MTMWKDLTMQLKSDLMQATGIFDPVRLRQEYDAYHLAQGGHIGATGMNMSPDWDPDNPYHYHTASGLKVIVTPEDWEKHKGLPYFKLVEDAVLAEQAAHPGPEYIINPQFSEDLRRVYKGNMGPLYQNYSSFSGNLPQGYSFTSEGLVQDNQGNLYVLKGFRQTPRFAYDESNPLIFPVLEGRNQGNVTFYPVNMERTIKPSLPVSSVMNVDKEHESAIRKAQNQYEYPVTLWDILPNGEGVISTYDNVYSTTPYYGDDYSKDYHPYKDKGAKQFFENYISNIIGREIKLNGPSYMWDDNSNFRNVYADDVFNLSSKEFNLVKKKLKDAKNKDYKFEKNRTEENLNKFKQEGLLTRDEEEVYRNSIKYYEDWINQDNPWLWGDEDRSPKPKKISRKEAEKKAVIEVGPLQINGVLTYAKGGHLHQYGEPIKQRLDFLNNFGTWILAAPRKLIKGKDDPVAHGDLGRYYFGLPLKNSVLEYSKYKPTKSKDKNSTYIAINDPYFKESVVNLFYDDNPLNWVDKLKNIRNGYHSVDYESAITENERLRNDKQFVTTFDLGRYMLTSGYDPYKGQYISYYDIWDSSGNRSHPNLKKPEWYHLWGSKPFEVYDRIYLDDYYGVNSTPQEDTYYGGWLAPVTVTPNEYKKGGSIHIKHPGRLTALKKRTGKTEAELWRTGSKAVRKMITFARNARKWKHLDGGYLDDIIWDNMGLWSHPGLITGITGTKDGTDITMNGVTDYLIGKDNLGNVKFMKPGMDYHFPGSSVVEYPLKYQFGGLFKKKETPNYLYTTYGLNDYSQQRYEGSYNNPIFGYQPLSGINQSIGKDYSMPDYNAVAYTSYPIYMNPSILTGDTNKEALAKQYLANFVLQDGIENTMNSKYYDKKRDRWTPQDSVEGGAKTIGKGLKMNNTNAEWYKTLKKQGYLTNELMEAGVNEMIGNFYGKARDIYNNRVGNGAWDKLDANKQALLMDYAYNGVLGKFNNFMDAVAADDKDRILKEYVRYSGGKKLGKRNDETLNWINSIWPDTYQYGGLIKLFSYTNIPVVRYGNGGYSYMR